MRYSAIKSALLSATMLMSAGALAAAETQDDEAKVQLAQAGVAAQTAPAAAPVESPAPVAAALTSERGERTESRIDFAQSAAQVERQIRAFAPAPGAFFELQGERFRILAAEISAGTGAAGTVLDNRLTIACGDLAIRPTLIQRAGKSAMSPADLLRGFAIPPGTVIA